MLDKSLPLPRAQRLFSVLMNGYQEDLKEVLKKQSETLENKSESENSWFTTLSASASQTFHAARQTVTSILPISTTIDKLSVVANNTTSNQIEQLRKMLELIYTIRKEKEFKDDISEKEFIMNLLLAVMAFNAPEEYQQSVGSMLHELIVEFGTKDPFDQNFSAALHCHAINNQFNLTFDVLKDVLSDRQKQTNEYENVTKDSLIPKTIPIINDYIHDNLANELLISSHEMANYLIFLSHILDFYHSSLIENLINQNLLKFGKHLNFSDISKLYGHFNLFDDNYLENKHKAHISDLLKLVSTHLPITIDDDRKTIAAQLINLFNHSLISDDFKNALILQMVNTILKDKITDTQKISFLLKVFLVIPVKNSNEELNDAIYKELGELAQSFEDIKFCINESLMEAQELKELTDFDSLKRWEELALTIILNITEGEKTDKEIRQEAIEWKETLIPMLTEKHPSFLKDFPNFEARLNDSFPADISNIDSEYNSETEDTRNNDISIEEDNKSIVKTSKPLFAEYVKERLAAKVRDGLIKQEDYDELILIANNVTSPKEQLKDLISKFYNIRFSIDESTFMFAIRKKIEPNAYEHIISLTQACIAELAFIFMTCYPSDSAIVINCLMQEEKEHQISSGNTGFEKALCEIVMQSELSKREIIVKYEDGNKSKPPKFSEISGSLATPQDCYLVLKVIFTSNFSELNLARMGFILNHIQTLIFNKQDDDISQLIKAYIKLLSEAQKNSNFSDELKKLIQDHQKNLLGTLPFKSNDPKIFMKHIKFYYELIEEFFIDKDKMVDLLFSAMNDPESNNHLNSRYVIPKRNEYYTIEDREKNIKLFEALFSLAPNVSKNYAFEKAFAQYIFAEILKKMKSGDVLDVVIINSISFIFDWMVALNTVKSVANDNWEAAKEEIDSIAKKTYTNIVSKLMFWRDYIKIINKILRSNANTIYIKVQREFISNTLTIMDSTTNIENIGDEEASSIINFLETLKPVLSHHENLLVEIQSKYIKAVTANLERKLHQIQQKFTEFFLSKASLNEVRLTRVKEKTCRDISELLNVLNGLNEKISSGSQKSQEEINFITKTFNDISRITDGIEKKLTFFSQACDKGILTGYLTILETPAVFKSYVENYLNQAKNKISLLSFSISGDIEDSIRKAANQSGISAFSQLNDIVKNLYKAIVIPSPPSFNSSITPLSMDGYLLNINIRRVIEPLLVDLVIIFMACYADSLAKLFPTHVSTPFEKDLNIAITYFNRDVTIQVENDDCLNILVKGGLRNSEGCYEILRTIMLVPSAQFNYNLMLFILKTFQAHILNEKIDELRFQAYIKHFYRLDTDPLFPDEAKSKIKTLREDLLVKWINCQNQNSGNFLRNLGDHWISKKKNDNKKEIVDKELIGRIHTTYNILIQHDSQNEPLIARIFDAGLENFQTDLKKSKEIFDVLFAFPTALQSMFKKKFVAHAIKKILSKNDERPQKQIECLSTINTSLDQVFNKASNAINNLPGEDKSPIYSELVSLINEGYKQVVRNLLVKQDVVELYIQIFRNFPRNSSREKFLTETLPIVSTPKVICNDGLKFLEFLKTLVEGKISDKKCKTLIQSIQIKIIENLLQKTLSVLDELQANLEIFQSLSDELKQFLSDDDQIINEISNEECSLNEIEKEKKILLEAILKEKNQISEISEKFNSPKNNENWKLPADFLAHISRHVSAKKKYTKRFAEINKNAEVLRDRLNTKIITLSSQNQANFKLIQKDYSTFLSEQTNKINAIEVAISQFSEAKNVFDALSWGDQASSSSIPVEMQKAFSNVGNIFQELPNSLNIKLPQALENDINFNALSLMEQKKFIEQNRANLDADIKQQNGVIQKAQRELTLSISIVDSWVSEEMSTSQKGLKKIERTIEAQSNQKTDLLNQQLQKRTAIAQNQKEIEEINQKISDLKTQLTDLDQSIHNSNAALLPADQTKQTTETHIRMLCQQIKPQIKTSLDTTINTLKETSNQLYWCEFFLPVWRFFNFFGIFDKNIDLRNTLQNTTTQSINNLTAEKNLLEQIYNHLDLPDPIVYEGKTLKKMPVVAQNLTDTINQALDQLEQNEKAIIDITTLTNTTVGKKLELENQLKLFEAKVIAAPQLESVLQNEIAQSQQTIVEIDNQKILSTVKKDSLIDKVQKLNNIKMQLTPLSEFKMTLLEEPAKPLATAIPGSFFATSSEETKESVKDLPQNKFSKV